MVVCMYVCMYGCMYACMHVFIRHLLPSHPGQLRIHGRQMKQSCNRMTRRWELQGGVLVRCGLMHCACLSSTWIGRNEDCVLKPIFSHDPFPSGIPLSILSSSHCIAQVAADEAMDELSGYESGIVPKVLVTTSTKPVGVIVCVCVCVCVYVCMYVCVCMCMYLFVCLCH